MTLACRSRTHVDGRSVSPDRVPQTANSANHDYRKPREHGGAPEQSTTALPHATRNPGLEAKLLMSTTLASFLADCFMARDVRVPAA